VKVFFERLDEELNKVNQFYKTKEREFLERGEVLNKQLQILLDRKQLLSDRRRKNLSQKSAPGFLPPSYSSSTRNSDYSESATEYSESPTAPSQTDNGNAAAANDGASPKTSRTKDGRPSTTALRAISAVTSTLWEDVVKNPKKEGPAGFINRKKNQGAEKMMRGAFVELYRGLGLLKTYSSLNMVAFTKILKKFDKVK
ncbi:hypothetical protein U1Q18_030947, partial [Sarracenia purpurea var. burkii]